MGKIADISKWQGVVDWSKAREELDFVILRASCGTGIDTKYLHNVAECGIPFGAYHYVKAGTAADAKAEAQFFVQCTKQGSVQPFFYVADIEYEAQTESTTEPVCVAFLETLRELGCGKIGMYINRKYKWAGKAIAMCDFMWIPHWGKNDGEVPADKYKSPYPHDLWQYTSKGTLAGVKGDVDLNVLTGTKPVGYFTSVQEVPAPGASDEGSVNPMLTNLQLVAYMLAVYAAKWVYWYGTCGYECTNSLYTRKKKQYPSHYGSSRDSGYKADIAAGKMCADCVGAIKSFFWKGGDINGKNVYQDNNCPDRSADGLFSMCKITGPISTIPPVPGLVVHKKGHIAVYDGKGKAIELRGFAADCKYDPLSAVAWEEWGYLPDSMLAYVTDGSVVPEPVAYKLGDRLPLEKGDEGTDVAELQQKLKGFGYDLGNYGANKDGVDGDFGSKTMSAVKSYQSAKDLPVNGKYDEATHAVMFDASPDPAQPEPEQPAPEKRSVVIKCNSGKVNIRQGDSTEYASIKQLADGTTLEYVATSPTGWHAVRWKKCIAWVSPNYSVVQGG